MRHETIARWRLAGGEVVSANLDGVPDVLSLKLLPAPETGKRYEKDRPVKQPDGHGNRW